MSTYMCLCVLRARYYETGKEKSDQDQRGSEEAESKEKMMCKPGIMVFVLCVWLLLNDEDGDEEMSKEN